MSNELPRIYAVHLHQKQENAQYKDELFRVDSRLDAIFKIHQIAEDHGYFEFSFDEIDKSEKVEIGSIVKLLRSTEFEVDDVEGSDLAECEDWFGFELEDPHAPDVGIRRVRFIRYVGFSGSLKG